MATPEAKLSRSLEDYLEAIYNLKVRNQFARVKDIARMMEVKMPSVTEAIRSLTSRGLVKHQPYENVELTDEGLDRARGIAHRHSAVKEFLTSVLGLDENDAETEACGIEHAIRPDTLDKLLKFVDFVRVCGGDKPLRLDDFRHFLAHSVYPEGCECQPSQPGTCGLRTTITSTKMSDLCPGMQGRIAFVSGKGPVRKRLMEMGLTSDTRFEVIRVAPLADPIEIKIRGYHLALRKSEAQHIEVELE
ncbi:MAG: metal-dependent transcriptional regulator [Armatimonadetes bacterium]|nr:metal-dependent transcriptional regulator [Armatimonadota bacterium]